ncbi:hypothetical protein PM10SUCC1_32270 [Propionigenium maris DSM 9537]|uniref:Baseplate protein J-like barrel domain-containing protein n=1 Tax=Propionigenium maris DSM 9537 TaxID=1123000 RepID=A0A9W6GMB2_9FUSO|nr:baseplate J/gp47 family protein [Propionigenium maris]GLI57713.1 hypothetical protein PM10SUCC1_32270 [Propionigenium maris DSM 9537]
MGVKYGVVPGVGFVRKTFDQRVEDCIARAKSAWGNSWEPQETAGEWMLIKNVLYEVDQAHQGQQELYTYMDDEAAKDNIQDSKYKLIGLKRKDKTYSFVVVNFVGTPGHIVKTGYLAKDSVKSKEYQLTEDVTFDANGNGSGQFKSLEKGEDSRIDPETLTIPITVDPDVNTITNLLASSGGLENETNDQFRARKERFLQESESSNAPAIRNAVLNLDSVSKCETYENYEATRMEEYDLEPGETRTIVQGINSEEVAKAIFSVVAAGIPTVGQYNYVVQGKNAQPKKTFFDLAINKIIYAKVEVSELADGQTLTPELQDQIKAIVLDYFANLNIKQTISATKLASLITSSIKEIFDCMVFINTTEDFTTWIRYIKPAYNEIGYTDIDKISVMST